MDDKAIKGLERRVARLESVVFRKNAKPARNIVSEDFSGARGGVRLLISKGFFNAKKTLGEVRRALADNGYHYSRQATDMALKGLASRKGPLILLKESGQNVYAKRK